jgi:hypothetical protein
MERTRPKEHQPVSLAEAAKTYAAAGWPVFPLAGKYPYKGTHGYLDATADPQEVTRMWQERPFANIGLATGAGSGVLVLDLDPRHAEKQQANLLRVLEERYGAQFRNTRTVRSAHGGLHLYYRHPKDGKTYPNTVKLGGIAGIDVRGDGGYVVLPPSKLYNTLSYHWGNLELPIAQAPDWLLSLLQHRREQEVCPQESRFAQCPGSKWLRRALQEATEGNQNLTGFHLACQLRDDGIAEAEAAEIMLHYAQHVPQGKTPYTVKEALASLKSAYRRPPRERARRSNF